VNVEETQRRQPQDDRVRAEFELGEQSSLILAYVLRTELIRPAPEISAEVLNAVQVCADRGIGEVAATNSSSMS
jgi:hypothetical protein